VAELRVNVDNLPSNPVNVTGTISTTPSGTQNVAVTGQPISVFSTSNPAITGSYIYSISNIAGVVAANNFMSVLNPVGSGKTVVFGGAFISSAAAGGTTNTEPIRGYRITTATGGVLVSNATEVAKLQTSFPTSIVEVRTGNPTVTLGPAVFNSPMANDNVTDPTPTHIITVPPGPGSFILAPGEGIVIRTEAGDVDQRLNLSVLWAEI
jgi:hypothetical protein